MTLTIDQANVLINAFYDAIVQRERDECRGMNEGLHAIAIEDAGFGLFTALTEDLNKQLNNMLTCLHQEKIE